MRYDGIGIIRKGYIEFERPIDIPDGSDIEFTVLKGKRPFKPVGPLSKRIMPIVMPGEELSETKERGMKLRRKFETLSKRKAPSRRAKP